jgi:hypothetical protein
MKDDMKTGISEGREPPINNLSLEYQKYSIDVLEENIHKLSLWKLLKTQILNREFCIKYILNDDYALCDEDTYITWQDVIQHQPHITEETNKKKHVKG